MTIIVLTYFTIEEFGDYRNNLVIVSFLMDTLIGIRIPMKMQNMLYFSSASIIFIGKNRNSRHFLKHLKTWT